MQIGRLLDEGLFLGLDLSDLDLLAETLGLENSPDHHQLFANVIEQMHQVTAEKVTGVVLEPNLSLPLLADKIHRGLILRLDSPQPQDPLSLPTLEPAWTLEHIAGNFATAYLNLYYHPNEDKALLKKQFLAEVYDSCQNLKINLMLNLIIFTPAEKDFEAEQFAADQLTAVTELAKWSDVFVLQYPTSALGAATLTAELDKPWLLMGAAYAYEELKEKYRECLENGAVGLMASNSLWEGIKGEVNENKALNISQIQKFIGAQFRDRMLELGRITEEYQAALRGSV